MIKKISIPLSLYVLFMLLVFSCVPLGFFAFFTIQLVKTPLYNLNQQNKIDQLAIDLQNLHGKLDSNKMMIGFVSQLPAALEILGHGAKREGAIDKTTAYRRYKGVLIRAFQQTDTISSAHILDLEKKVVFSLQRESSTGQFHLVNSPSLSIDTSFVEKATAMTKKGFYLSPLLQNKLSSPEEHDSSLIVQILTPIFFNQENVGTFISEIDISKFLQIYDTFDWVISNGTYISGNSKGRNAFDEINGLQELFVRGGQDILEQERGSPIVWMPFLHGKDVNLALWAGSSIELDSVKTANKNVVKTISLLLVLLFISIAFTATLISYFVNRGARRLLRHINQVLVDDCTSSYQPRSVISEVSEYYSELEEVLSANLKLKENQLLYKEELEQALAEVKELQGIIPICSHCKMIRDDEGSWEQLEKYLQDHSDAQFSHSLCDKCVKIYHPDYVKKNTD